MDNQNEQKQEQQVLTEKLEEDLGISDVKNELFKTLFNKLSEELSQSVKKEVYKTLINNKVNLPSQQDQEHEKTPEELAFEAIEEKNNLNKELIKKWL